VSHVALDADDRIAVKPREAARLTGLSHGTIYKLINDGTLRRSKIGRATLIPVADLYALIESGVAQ
jgi:excisionase family DNA binding protein